MKHIPLLSIAYLPPVSYIRYCMKNEEVVLEQHEHYIKQSYRNRCHIYGANGLLPLVIPVNHQDLYKVPIAEVRISYESPWQKIHWRSIESAYRNSPFFEYYEDDFRQFYLQPVEKLFDWNFHLLQKIFSILQIETKLRRSTAYEKNPIDLTDLRAACKPGENPDVRGIRYQQVFQDKKSFGFLPDLSVIDLLFNEGKYARDLLTAD